MTGPEVDGPEDWEEIGAESEEGRGGGGEVARRLRSGVASARAVLLVSARSFSSFLASIGCCSEAGRVGRFGTLTLGWAGRRASWCSSTRERGARCTCEARLLSAFVGTVKALLRFTGWKMLFFFFGPNSERGIE